MALKEGDIENFKTLCHAGKNGDLVLVESKDAETGEYRALICAKHYHGEAIVLVPFGHMCTDNPYKQYVDPIKAMEDDNTISKITPESGETRE